MVQLRSPLASVVPLQDCAVEPDPMVKVTTLVGSGVPEVGLLVVSGPDRGTGWPLAAGVQPAEVRLLVSGLTWTLVVELSEPMGVDVVVSPGNDALSV